MVKKHPYPDWEGRLDETIFRHVSFEQFVSPYKCHTHSLASEYVMPDLMEYSYNKQNFRSMEFGENAELVVLGCSHTFGAGVPQNLIWPSFAKDLLNIKHVANLGINGCSIARQVRTLSTYIRYYGAPKMILCTFPELTRYEHVDENGRILDGSTSRGMQDNSYTAEQAATQSIIALSALEAMCQASNIVLRWQMWADISEFHKKKLSEHFSYFVPNKYTINYLQLKNPIIDEKTGEVEGVYSHDDWPVGCCSELKSISKGCFNYGYDRYSVPKKYQDHGLFIKKTKLEKLKKQTLRIEDDRVVAHFGSHAHWHWAKNLVDSL
jgi:hypothetical protein